MRVTLPRYAAYRPSSVDWLGDVPASWKVRRLKYVAQQIVDKIDQPLSNRRYIGLEHVASWSGKLTDADEDTQTEGGCSLFRPGDVLFGKLRPYLAKGFEAEFNGQCSSEFIVLRPIQVSSHFLRHLMLSPPVVRAIDASTFGAKMPRAAPESIMGLSVPIPPDDEQSAIAAFLDRETNRIDVLIEKKRRLIELLEEKRNAVIARATTKGLDPTSQMKSSGIDWLGDIPAHWTVGPLKHFVRQEPGAIKTGPFGSQLTSAEMMSGNIKVYNQRNVIDADCMSGDNFITQAKFSELSSFETFPGDVLLTTRGTIGAAYIVPANAPQGILHPCVLRIQPEPSLLDADFLLLLIQDSHLLQTQLQFMSNSTTIDVIYSETIASLKIPLPPIDEQREIAATQRAASAAFKNAIEKTRNAISLLEEHRKSLISAAVTGKIDVRDCSHSSVLRVVKEPLEAAQ